MLKLDKLKLKEESVRIAGLKFKKALSIVEELELNLIGTIADYDELREDLQREEFTEKGLRWCQGCEKYHPKKDVSLYYTQIMEQRGASTIFVQLRRLESICKKCYNEALIRYHSEEEEFVCYLAEKRGDEFYILVSGKWEKLLDLEGVSVKIDRDNIPGVEYTVGKVINYETDPFILKIGDEKEV